MCVHIHHRYIGFIKVCNHGVGRRYVEEKPSQKKDQNILYKASGNEKIQCDNTYYAITSICSISESITYVIPCILLWDIIPCICSVLIWIKLTQTK